MQYRQVGNSGLRVSCLSLGTMTFGGRGEFAAAGATDVAGARRQLDMCLAAGVNMVDTADMYSDGLAEEILGQVLVGRREQVIVATKVRMRTGPGPNDEGLSRQHVIAACDRSLRRLGLDHIDLYQVHGWDGETPVDETSDALDSLVRAGKVRYLGCSNFSGWHLMKSLAAADSGGRHRFISHQICYSLQSRDAEYELIPAALDQGVGLLVWSPLAGGLLSGKFRRGIAAPAGSRRAGGWNEPPIQSWEQLYNIVDLLIEVSAAHQTTVAAIALAYLLRKPGVASLVIGARTDEQLADNLAAATIELSQDEFDRLDELSAPPLLYPYWHQAESAAARLSAADLALLGRHLGDSEAV